MFYKRLKQENKELKYMVELLKKQNDEKSEWIKHLIKKSEGQEIAFNNSATMLSEITGFSKEDVDNACKSLYELGEIKKSDWRTANDEFASKSYVLKETHVSDLQCSARLRNILKGLIYRNEDQSFKSVFNIYSRRDLQEHRGMGVKLFDELDSMRLEAGIEYKR